MWKRPVCHSNHDAMTQCCFTAGQPSLTLTQNKTSIASTYLVCWCGTCGPLVHSIRLWLKTQMYSNAGWVGWLSSGLLIQCCKLFKDMECAVLSMCKTIFTHSRTETNNGAMGHVFVLLCSIFSGWRRKNTPTPPPPPTHTHTPRRRKYSCPLGHVKVYMQLQWQIHPFIFMVDVVYVIRI